MSSWQLWTYDLIYDGDDWVVNDRFKHSIIDLPLDPTNEEVLAKLKKAEVFSEDLATFTTVVCYLYGDDSYLTVDQDGIPLCELCLLPEKEV